LYSHLRALPVQFYLLFRLTQWTDHVSFITHTIHTIHTISQLPFLPPPPPPPSHPTSQDSTTTPSTHLRIIANTIYINNRFLRPEPPSPLTSPSTSTRQLIPILRYPTQHISQLIAALYPGRQSSWRVRPGVAVFCTKKPWL